MLIIFFENIYLTFEQLREYFILVHNNIKICHTKEFNLDDLKVNILFHEVSYRDSRKL